MPTTVVGSYASLLVCRQGAWPSLRGRGHRCGHDRDDTSPDRHSDGTQSDRELGAGIIDIRTHYCETPDDVAERVRTCLRHVPADKLFLTTDCGLRYVHRTLAREKITNLVAGVRIVRDEM